MKKSSTSRRQFLKYSAAAAGSVAVAGAFKAFLDRTARGESARTAPDYGLLRPVADEATGLELLQLPEGFRYISFGWTGDEMSDGNRTPPSHDGMAVIAAEGDTITLCRNHEVTNPGDPFGGPPITYDARGAGGCTNLLFDSNEGRWLKSFSSLAGTVRNCAGGPTPWGSWLSCEETLNEQVDDDGERTGLLHTHGWIFEVPANKPAAAVPLKDMGRFVHEAVAVDPDTGYVYETEDRGRAGFYRFIPNEPGRLVAGGRLQMLKVAGRSDLSRGCRVGETLETEWVDIEEPHRPHSPGTRDEHGVFSQGEQQQATRFARLEGCWYGNGAIYFDSTSGGDAGEGQIWRYEPASERLSLLFESPGADVLDSPDNLAVSPRGGLVLCEDGGSPQMRMHGLTTDGRIFPLALNNIRLSGERNGIEGDFRDREWAGATFSADGRWLFANVQTPGITFAITGPWEDGGL